MFQIVDNGTECLVEPCDSWDVLDASGKLLEKVSMIEHNGLRVYPQTAMTSVEGRLEDYKVTEGPNAGVMKSEVCVVKIIAGAGTDEIALHVGGLREQRSASDRCRAALAHTRTVRAFEASCGSMPHFA